MHVAFIQQLHSATLHIKSLKTPRFLALLLHFENIAVIEAGNFTTWKEKKDHADNTKSEKSSDTISTALFLPKSCMETNCIFWAMAHSSKQHTVEAP